MNRKDLFSLTAQQKRVCSTQPDASTGAYWASTDDEFDQPPLLPGTTVRFWYNTTPEGYPSHWHNEVELLLPVEEGYTVTVEETTYLLSPGDLFVIPPGCVHSLSAPPKGSRFVLLFEGIPSSMSHFFSQRSLPFSEPVLINAGTCPQIYEKVLSLIFRMISVYWSESSVRQLHIYSCLLEFYAVCADFQLEKGTASPAKNPHLKMDELLSYLEQHYAEKISLEKAASMASLSKYHFSRVFRSCTGQTFAAWLNSLRVQASENLLRETSLSIGEIAGKCGFSSLSAFHRNFQDANGCTPSEFRRRHLP